MGEVQGLICGGLHMEYGSREAAERSAERFRGCARLMLWGFLGGGGVDVYSGALAARERAQNHSSLVPWGWLKSSFPDLER